MAEKPVAGIGRRKFLGSGFALVVGFSTTGSAILKPVFAQAPTSPAPRLYPGAPDPDTVDAWLAIYPDNTAMLYHGYVELGQGGPTALRQIAAEELDMDFDQILYHPVETGISQPGSTFASMTIGRGGPPLRAAAAEARMALLRMASQRLKTPLYGLVVSKGVVSVNGNPALAVTYGALVGGRKFGNVKVTGKVLPKSVGDYEIVGTRVRRPDVEEKARGTYIHIQHIRMPGMLHGRVVRPRGQGALGIDPKVVAIDPASIAELPGVRIVRRNNFVAVVATREWDAVRAAAQLKVTWQRSGSLPGNDGLWDYFRQAAADKKTNDDLIVDGDVSDLEKHPYVVKATFRAPYLSHGTMAPNCALANVTRDEATIIAPTQVLYETRANVARVLGMPEDKVRVQYGASSCTFGMSCYEDAAAAAAIISQEIGKPVRVQFMRWDELGWDAYAPPHLADVRAAADANGKIQMFDYRGWSHGYVSMAAASAHLASGETAQTRPQIPSGTNRTRLSMNDMYDIPVRRMLDHDVHGPGLLRGGYLRAPLDPHYFFAAEQTIDHLAYLAKIDPLEFRLRNISHRRWRGVLEAAARAAKWQPRVAASASSGGPIVTGRGLGLGNHHVPTGNQEDRVTYAAAVAEVEVNTQTGLVIATHIYAAMDVGLAINPGNVESQIIGMSNHGASIALKEEVLFSTSNVTSLDWNTYRTLRFGEHPAVTPIVVQQLLQKSSGAGEEALPAVVSALGNAVFDAIGKRVYEFPMTPARVLAALTA